MGFGTRTIIHVDMDAFYASVESRDNPELKGKPLIIGALPTDNRGVVATCSYEARKFGVRSAMPISEAYRKCPQGIYMEPNIPKYKKVSKIFHAIWDSYSDKVEYVSLDEGYIDVTGSLVLFGGAISIAQEIKRRTQEETGLTCSIGVGYSMASAKLASEENKPNGLFVVQDRQAFKDLIIDRGIRTIFGIGEKTEKQLNKAGFYKVRDVLQAKDKVIKLMGNKGIQIIEMAEGIDNREVIAHNDADVKSIGKETTFQYDTEDIEYLKSYVIIFSREVSNRALKLGLFAQTITLKITYGDMATITRSKSQHSTNSFDSICRAALSLLGEIQIKPVRLIGVTISNFVKDFQYSLYDWKLSKGEGLDEVLTKIQDKFGQIKTGLEIEAERKIRQVLGEDS